MATGKSTILITGAGGFIGQDLAAELGRTYADHQIILTDTFKPPTPPGIDASVSNRMTCIAADLTQPSSHDQLLGHSLVAAYTLHGIMSSGSEANLELGLRVNLDSHRLLLDALRAKHPGIKVVFPSSTAIFGRAPPDGSAAFTEKTLPLPQGSYGTQKLMVELLVNDYSRRGLIDGRICRLPTVVVRPGAPSAAASSFASGIVRESLKGEENVLPTRRDLELWVCSPGAVVRNLVRVLEVPKEKFASQGARRINLPGQTVTVQQILDALEQVGGKQARALVKEEKDEKIEALVESWPTKFDISYAKGLGLEGDIDLAENIKAFVASLRK